MTPTEQATGRPHPTGNWPTAIYGISAYASFLAVVVWLVGFLANAWPHSRIDGPARSGAGLALVIDLALLALFGVQHSVMARGWFKRAALRVIPASAERSTYVLASSVAVAALLLGWQPIPTVLLQARGTGAAVLTGLFWISCLLVVAATFAIDHAELFGLRHTLSPLGVLAPPQGRLHTPWPYRLVRHPLMTATLLVLWVTPQLTWGRLLLAAGLTGYILVGTTFEERALVAQFGDSYRQYQRRVGRFLPRLW